MTKDPHILIVDDTINNIRLLCEMLQAQKELRINVARDGLEALEICDKVNIDLILMDVQMPRMNGFETSKILKSKPATQNIPIIFLTAQNDKEHILKAFEIGAVDYVTKPFSNYELISRINTHLELKQHQDHLTELVEKRTKDLTEALEKIKANARAKDEFLATMSHEIRTPMNGIQGISLLLSDTNLDETQREYLDMMRHSSDYLRHIIDDIFEYTLIHTGDIKVHHELISPKEFFEESIKVFKFRAQEKCLDFKLDISSNMPRFLTLDAVKLRSVIDHILSNALKFTSIGGVKVSIECLDDGSSLYMSFTDSGIGISKENVKRIFEKFTQVDSSDSREFQGTGLGLALCRDLIELMGGTDRKSVV